MSSTVTVHGSIVASSSSMTGMSSLIGNTRLHCEHLSAAPFLTRSTFVLQLGQARISSNSGSTGMGFSSTGLTARFVSRDRRGHYNHEDAANNPNACDGDGGCTPARDGAARRV